MNNQDEYRRVVASLRNSRVSQYLSTGVLVSSIGASLYLLSGRYTKELSKVLIPIGLASGVAATMVSKTANEMDELLLDWQDISDQQTTNRRYQQLEPVEQVSLPANTVRPFNWSLLSTQKDTYPHIEIVTKSGGGKSTLAEWLCSLLGGSTIAVAPHWTPGDYPTATTISGAGRDILGEVDTSLSPYPYLNEVLEGKQVSVVELLSYLLADMKYRYELDPMTGQRRGGEPVNIILDEYPIYSLLPKVSEVVLALLREARKVGIRLIIITQSSLGSALGLSSQDKQNLTSIRLGNLAIEYCQYLYNQCRQSSQEQGQTGTILDTLKATDRPCMVEDNLALVPTVVRV